MDYKYLIDYLTREAVAQCSLQDISLPRPLVQYLIKWLVIKHAEELMNADEAAALTLYQSIYDQIIQNTPAVQMIRLKHYFEVTAKLDIPSIQEKYEKITNAKLDPLLDHICGSPAGTKREHDNLVKKMATYIVAYNKLFSPRNSEMINLARRALESILTKQDIINFVTHKKPFQVDFIARVGKIMSGVLLFNRHCIKGIGRKAIRYVINDAFTAYENTLERLHQKLRHAGNLILRGLRVVVRSAEVSLNDQQLIYNLPEGVLLNDLETFNKFIYVHLLYEWYIKMLVEIVVAQKEHIDHDVGELKECIYKLEEIVKYRTVVPTQDIFPNFRILFEAWHKVLMKLYFMVEINQIIDTMDEIITSDYPYMEMSVKIGTKEFPRHSYSQQLTRFPTEEVPCPVLPPEPMPKYKTIPFPKTHLQTFCFLTMSLTDGLLLRSDSTLGVLPFLNEEIAFKTTDYLNFVEKNYECIKKNFLESVYRNPEMCILFKMPIDLESLIQIPFEDIIKKKETFDVGIQYEFCLPPATIESKCTYSWNIWDYRRRAIQLANLRKCLTHSFQTRLTYSSRNEAIQTYAKRSNTQITNSVAIQWSRSVCRRLDCIKKARKPGFCCPHTNE